MPETDPVELLLGMADEIAAETPLEVGITSSGRCCGEAASGPIIARVTCLNQYSAQLLWGGDPHAYHALIERALDEVAHDRELQWRTAVDALRSCLYASLLATMKLRAANTAANTAATAANTAANMASPAEDIMGVTAEASAAASIGVPDTIWSRWMAVADSFWQLAQATRPRIEPAADPRGYVGPASALVEVLSFAHGHAGAAGAAWSRRLFAESAEPGAAGLRHFAGSIFPGAVARLDALPAVEGVQQFLFVEQPPTEPDWAPPVAPRPPHYWRQRTPPRALRELGL